MPNPKPPADDGQITNQRDPHALLGAKRSDTDAQVRAAFERTLLVHSPAHVGSEAALREVEDAFDRADCEVVVSAPHALAAALASAGVRL